MRKKAKNGSIYLEIRWAIYSLPQEGGLANKQLKEQLTPAGYYEVTHMPGLWKHISYPIQSTLIVDDFRVKYVSKQHANHLIKALTKEYKFQRIGQEDCTAALIWNGIMTNEC